MKRKVLILVAHGISVYALRLELVQQLLSDGHSVIVALPFGEHVEHLKVLGCECREVQVDRHGMSPIADLKLLLSYRRLLRDEKPDVVFSYTIKPNVYGGLACQWENIPYIANVTGLGSAIENGGIKRRIALALYRIGLKRAECVFFQNTYNRDFMLQYGIKSSRMEILPGSGVNLIKHCLELYPREQDKLVFLIIGRLMKDKGTDEILSAARIVKKEYPCVVFRFIGFYDGDYEEKVKSAVKDGIIEYLGSVSDVHSYIKDSHATIHASYHEGMANVLLESAACGRPVIATDIPGCRETFVDGLSGYSCQKRDVDSLVDAIRKFIQLPHEEKARMGLAGREKMEKEFDRKIVVDRYMHEISNLGDTEYESV